MGPIALFDKSFLEGLNVDEAVLFDHFFYPVTCPIFYVETLADLEKPGNRGRRPEEVVGSIAFKTPQMHGGPNVHHRTLVIGDLLGQEIAMTGQIVVAGGIPIQIDGANNVVFKPMPESEAFSRWQRGQFEEIERSSAKRWREELRTLDLHDVAKQAQHYGLDLSTCKTIAHAKDLADRVISDLPNDRQIAFAIDKFRINKPEREEIQHLWEAMGRPALAAYAPYAHFVLTIEVFFEIALATGKISADRASNINDLAYLFYLPFCMVFLSTDRLHRTCAPLFMRQDQQFLWGTDVKADLQANHVALMQLPEDDRKKGLIALNTPPKPGGLIADVYSRHFKPRTPLPPRAVEPDGPSQHELEARIKRLREAANEQGIAEPNFMPNDAQAIAIERLVQKKRGSWYQVPHDAKFVGE